MKTKKTTAIQALVLLALSLTLALAFTACSKSDGGGSSGGSGSGSVGGGGDKSLNSATELKEYLDQQPANSPDQPIKVAMKANDMMIKDIVKVMNDAGKYVSLDLSGSPLTEIPRAAFYGCKTLSGITIPNSVTSIRSDAFGRCDNLTSVTFQGTIPSSGFGAAGDIAPFYGDLESKYLAGGIGTYTRTAETNNIGTFYTWTKQ